MTGTHRPPPVRRSAAFRSVMHALIVSMGVAINGLAGQPADRGPVATPLAGRLPVPDEHALGRAEAAVRDVYWDDLAGARRTSERLALGRKLLEEAAQTDDDPAACFALINEACRLGIEAGSPELILAAVGEMARRYQVDQLRRKEEYLAKAVASARTSTTRRAVAEACLALIAEAVLADRFDVAIECARAVYSAAEEATDTRLRAEILPRGKQLVALEKEFRRVQQAEETLAENPNDPDANLVCGRYLCLVKEDWDRGLPMLAGGNDPEWQALARKDLEEPADPQARLELGDGWWEMAQTRTEPAKSSLLRQARRWYLPAMPQLTGAEKSRVIARLAEIKGYGRGTGTGPSAQRAESSGDRPSAPPAVLSGQWGELLSLVDPQKHSVAPGWRFQNEALEVSPASPCARLTIPIAPDGAYDLKIELTRKVGFSTVGVILPVGSRQCLLALNYGGGASGLDTIAEQRADNNPSTFVGALNNDRRYTLEVAVRPDGQQAAVTATLDGRPFLFYRGPLRTLDLSREWRLPCRNCLGLAAQSGALFHSVKLKMVSGKAKLVE